MAIYLLLMQDDDVWQTFTDEEKQGWIGKIRSFAMMIEERIVQAMTKGRSATLRLQEPFPVIIAYSTAAIRDGRVYFFPDIYGQDRILDAALRQRSRNLQAFNQGKIGAESIN